MRTDGPSMIAKSVALLLADLGVTKTHGRPHVSNDNPYSESQFKTLKYSPEFPERFGSLQDARSFLLDFFQWYNTQHHHSGLGLLTPLDVHYGLAESTTHRAGGGLAEGLRGDPGAVRPRRAHTAGPPPGGVDQQTETGRRGSAHGGARRSPGVDPAARRARGAPEGVAQRARQAEDSGGAEPCVDVGEQAKELYTKL